MMQVVHRVPFNIALAYITSMHSHGRVYIYILFRMSYVYMHCTEGPQSLYVADGALFEQQHAPGHIIISMVYV